VLLVYDDVEGMMLWESIEFEDIAIGTKGYWYPITRQLSSYVIDKDLAN